MPKARDEILQRLSTQGSKSKLPAFWNSKNNFRDLSAQLGKALKRVKGEVHQAADLDEAWDILEKILDDLNAKKIVVADDDPTTQINLPSRFSGREWFLVGTSEGDLRAFCASADVGLTSADVALAETGSVILSAGPGQSRAGSLLPPVHIVLLPTSKLIPDIITWSANRQGDMPSQLVIISGPSKTADIEQTLVVGVHGPKRFIVILYGE